MWARHKTYYSSPIRAGLLPELNSTQAKIPGFDLDAIQKAHVLLIGAGGIGSAVAALLTRKGVGRLTIVDDDIVELKNLTRQWYARDDIGHYKVHCLARSLSRAALFPTRFDAYPFRFQEVLARGKTIGDPTVVCVGVDNNVTRRAVCEYALEQNVPVIYAAVSRGGNEAYAMVQEPRQACWACALPHQVNDETYPCGLPGIVDVLTVVAGQVVFAVDTLVCDRPRCWNLRHMFLDGSVPDRSRMVARRMDCALCGYIPALIGAEDGN